MSFRYVLDWLVASWYCHDFWGGQDFITSGKNPPRIQVFFLISGPFPGIFCWFFAGLASPDFTSSGRPFSTFLYKIRLFCFSYDSLLFHNTFRTYNDFMFYLLAYYSISLTLNMPWLVWYTIVLYTTKKEKRKLQIKLWCLNDSPVPCRNWSQQPLIALRFLSSILRVWKFLLLVVALLRMWWTILLHMQQ